MVHAVVFNENFSPELDQPVLLVQRGSVLVALPSDRLHPPNVSVICPAASDTGSGYERRIPMRGTFVGEVLYADLELGRERGR